MVNERALNTTKKILGFVGRGLKEAINTTADGLSYGYKKGSGLKSQSQNGTSFRRQKTAKIRPLKLNRYNIMSSNQRQLKSKIYNAKKDVRHKRLTSNRYETIKNPFNRSQVESLGIPYHENISKRDAELIERDLGRRN